MKHTNPLGERSRRRRRTALRLVTELIVVYLLFCGLLAYDAVRPKAGTLEGSPSQFGARYDEVSFRSSDGTRIYGWLVPAKKQFGIVVLCHGVAANRSDMLYEAERLYQSGFEVLLIDFRSLGKSEGTRCTLGRREVDDLIAAVHYLKNRPDTRSLPLGVMGQSMGGAVALMATARCPEIQAVIAESPFATLDRAANNRFRMVLGTLGPVLLAPERWIGEGLAGGATCEVSPLREVQGISPRPVLLIQDGADPLCPPEETRDLMAAIPGPKELWTVPGASHVGAKVMSPQEFDHRIVAFFQRTLARRRVPPGRVAPVAPTLVTRKPGRA